MNACFDSRPLARQAGLSTGELRELEFCIRSQYGRDEMMMELRVLRTVQAISEGATTLQAAMQELGATGVRRHPAPGAS